jgi:hypothetical protein
MGWELLPRCFEEDGTWRCQTNEVNLEPDRSLVLVLLLVVDWSDASRTRRRTTTRTSTM